MRELAVSAKAIDHMAIRAGPHIRKYTRKKAFRLSGNYLTLIVPPYPEPTLCNPEPLCIKRCRPSLAMALALVFSKTHTKHDTLDHMRQTF